MAATSVARSLGKLVPSQTCLFVCDIQERFRPVITGMPTVIDTARRLPVERAAARAAAQIRGAAALELPVVVTEQYPKALGTTVQELVEFLPAGTPVVAKTNFSMVVPEVEEFLLQRASVKQVLLCGIEAHVCVLQTTLDLLEKGYEVHVVVDGVSSQRATDRAAAMHRMVQSGAFTATSEMVLFQLMKGATHPQFKTISKLVQEPRPDPIVSGTML